MKVKESADEIKFSPHLVARYEHTALVEKWSFEKLSAFGFTSFFYDPFSLFYSLAK